MKSNFFNLRQFVLLAVVVATCFSSLAQADIQVPNLRLKVGLYPMSLDAGNLLPADEPLNAMVTLQPTVLWDLPSFRSRIGVHYLIDFNSDYGLTPISGIGFSGYFYLFGISSAYEFMQDGTLVQKSRPGPYVFGGITPVNFNLNVADPVSGADRSFRAFIVEIALGAGVDYALRRNLLASFEVGYRTGSSPESNGAISGSVGYKGLGAMLSFSMSYY